MGPEVILAMTIASIVGPIAGDLIGQVAGAPDKAKAMELVEQARQRFNISIPEIQQLAPQIAKTAMSGVQADPMAVAAQHEALANLQRYGTEGTNNPEFRAAMDEAGAEAGQVANQRQAAVQQQMQAEGMGNSGTAYALQQQAGADAANRVGHAGFQAAAEGRREALQAMQQYGAMGGNIREQDVAEQTAKARASDELAKYNANMSAHAYRDRFGMQMGEATAQSNADLGAANVYKGNAAQVQNQWQGYGDKVGAGAAAGAQYGVEEERRKRQQGANAFAGSTAGAS